MEIHLDSDIFDIVDCNKKTVEARLNDEKRRKLKKGDKSVFLRRPDDIDKREAIIEDLEYYNDFEEMVKHYSINELYLPNYTKEDFLKLLERFYTKLDEEKYGVVAIKFRKI